MNPTLTRILLADDHPALHSALALLLETRLNAHIVGQSSTMEDLLTSLPVIHPSLVILDWELPGSPKAGRVRALRRIDPALKVVITSAQPDVARKARAARADAFVCKCEPPEQILQVLQSL
jgi:DNA-binding NarL/FixJ family response regulator